MLLSLFVLTCSDATTKWLGADYPAGQIICFRAIFSLIPILVMVVLQGGKASLRIVDRRRQAWRAFFSSLNSMSMAPIFTGLGANRRGLRAVKPIAPWRRTR